MATTFQMTFSNAFFFIKIPIKISLKFVPKDPINNIPPLVGIMAWCRPGDKPLSEPILVSLLMYICVTQLQWFNSNSHLHNGHYLYQSTTNANHLSWFIFVSHPWLFFNSLAPGIFKWNFRYVIFKQIVMIDGRGISCEIALLWMSLDFIDDQSTLVQVMAWCRQATNHYLSQCWPRSLSSYGVTRPQWVDLHICKVSDTTPVTFSLIGQDLAQTKNRKHYYPM